jgi:hypothetical protein
MAKKVREDGFDSDEEMYFSWWVDEMVKAGHIVDAVFHPDSLLMTDGNKGTYISRRIPKGKTKVKVECRPFDKLPKMVYTPDWLITFSDEFINNLGEQTTEFSADEWGTKFPQFLLSDGKWWVDIKGAASKFDDGRFFRAMQKVSYANHGIFPQRIEISNKESGLFANTFTPADYLLTLKTKKPRKLNYDPLSIKQYLGRFFL